MRFKLNKFDRLVGISTIIGIAGLIVVIFFTGSTKKWFVKKLNYYTIFDTASGITKGMELTYRGFTIGKVRSTTLQGHSVRTDFYILADYEDYVREGSIVQLITSPIGLGSSFVFHPGRGEGLVPVNSEIYRLDSEFAEEILAKNLNRIQAQSDSIGVLLSKVSSLLDNVNRLLSSVNDGVSGRGNTELSAIIQTVRGLLENIESLTAASGNSGILANIVGDDFNAQINAIVSNLGTVTKGVDGLISGVSPEIQILLVQLQSTMVQVQDVLVGLKNNPLIKNGVPDRSNENSAAPILRNTDF